MKVSARLATAIVGVAALRASAGSVEGTCLESWSLPNFQPKSSTYHQKVASSSYGDELTVLVFLASW